MPRLQESICQQRAGVTDHRHGEEIAPGQHAPGHSEWSPPPGSSDFLSGGGKMGERICAFDWGPTPLGPISGWPQCLRTALGLCLKSRFPNTII
jgi:hypothetical protein